MANKQKPQNIIRQNYVLVSEVVTIQKRSSYEMENIEFDAASFQLDPNEWEEIDTFDTANLPVLPEFDPTQPQRFEEEEEEENNRIVMEPGEET